MSLTPMPVPADLSPVFPDDLVQVVIKSFGYGHAPAPRADITLDTRTSLRNPHHDPAMRYLTGLDMAVRSHVMTTPGATGMLRNLAAMVTAMLDDFVNAQGRVVRVAIGCVGGRHRSVALAEELAASLRADGVGVEVDHRDIAKPVLDKGAHR
ncbi:RNase adapter RapZ [Nonomuraea muscovyensis]|uniref:RapZ C-terminal domain-containing protein n=1 Tax=Nonomuraea muscovyensis TaxID=1124761 RepID=UPI0033DF2833